jgi:hypothetical protein
MAYCIWGNFQSGQMNLLPTSIPNFSLPGCLANLSINYLILRERREHRIFQLLLQMIPGLEDRLLNGSEENVTHIAELVCFILPTIYLAPVGDTNHTPRSREVCQVPDLTTPRA